MKRIEQRFSYLYKGESFAAVLFVFLSFLVNKTYPELRLYALYSFWFSFILLEFILLQGTMYWYAKWKKLKDERISITPEHVVKRLNHLKKLNVIWMIVTPILFIVDVIKWSPDLPGGGIAISGFIYVFACLEYINYFHYQLSYDNSSDIRYLLQTRKIKRSSLSKDLRKMSAHQAD